MKQGFETATKYYLSQTSFKHKNDTCLVLSKKIYTLEGKIHR